MIIHNSRGEYPIRFETLPEAFAAVPADAFVITDKNVADAWGQAALDRSMLILPAGESTKRLDRVEEGLEWLARAGATRRSTLVAFGGGVIGDLAGTIAALYMRGIDLWQIPTTLLAQVDSSVGGKVGVDLVAGKNLAGAFYPPKAVSICAEVLSTLPPRQLVNGSAEVWKYGYIGDLELLASLRSGTPAHEPAMVKRCINDKRRVVEADEFETNGLRATLNFGHTVGHALERVCNYERFLHGEAVAIGMVVEAEWGEAIGVTTPGTAEIVRNDLQTAGLPVEIPLELRAPSLIDAMFSDKKRESGTRLAASLIIEMGTCKLFRDLDPGELAGVILDR